MKRKKKTHRNECTKKIFSIVFRTRIADPPTDVQDNIITRARPVAIAKWSVFSFSFLCFPLFEKLFKSPVTVRWKTVEKLFRTRRDLRSGRVLCVHDENERLPSVYIISYRNAEQSGKFADEYCKCTLCFALYLRSVSIEKRKKLPIFS